MEQNILNNQNQLKAARLAEHLDSQQADIQKKALDLALAAGDEEEAAKVIRIIRNRLLAESDAQVTLDRLDFDVSTTTKFLNSLKEVLEGDWAVYRQNLRDIPEQAGFPLNTVFPDAPDTQNTVSE